MARRDAWLAAGRPGWGAAVPIGLALFAAWDLRSFLGPGLPLFFDAHSHLARTGFAAQALGAGEFPSWSNAWYAGSPVFEFASPLYYWATGALALATGDAVAATKLGLWLGQLVLLLGFFRFLRGLGQAPLVAAVGTALLLRSPLVRWVVGTVGNYPSLIPLAALPFLLALAQRQLTRGTLRSFFAGQALLLSLMLAGHLTNALGLLPAFLAFELALVWLARPAGRERSRAAAAIALSIAAALGVASFVIGPLLLGLAQVSLSLVAADPPALRFELEPLLVFAGLAPFSWDYNLVHHHGAPLVGVALGTGLYSLSARGRALRPAAAGLAASLLALPLLGDRSALAAPFFLCALVSAALGVAADLAARLHRLAGPTLALAAFGAAAAWPGTDTGSEVPKYVPPGALEVYAHVPDSPTRSRTFDVTPSGLGLDGFYGWSSASPLWSGRSIPFGGFPQGSFLETNVLLSLAGRWVQERDTVSPWSRLSLDLFYLAHVEFLVDRVDWLRAHAPVLAPTADSVGWDLLRLRQATPAIFSERVSVLAPGPGEAGEVDSAALARLRRRWLSHPAGEAKFRDSSLRPLARLRERTADWELLAKVVSAMGIDRRRATARQLFAARELPPAPGAGEPAPGERGFAVLDHSETLTSARLATRSARPGYLRVSYSYSPDLRVELDGEPVPAVPDALGEALLVGLPAGAHTLEIRAPDPSLQAGWALASALAALGLALLAARRAA